MPSLSLIFVEGQISIENECQTTLTCRAEQLEEWRFEEPLPVPHQHQHENRIHHAQARFDEKHWQKIGRNRPHPRRFRWNWSERTHARLDLTLSSSFRVLSRRLEKRDCTSIEET